MNDEQLYLDATQEVDSGTQAPALWAKAMALAEGDEKKPKYRYIALRVEQASEEGKTPKVEPSSSCSLLKEDIPIPQNWNALTGNDENEVVLTKEKVIRGGISKLWVFKEIEDAAAHRLSS